MEKTSLPTIDEEQFNTTEEYRSDVLQFIDSQYAPENSFQRNILLSSLNSREPNEHKNAVFNILKNDTEKFLKRRPTRQKTICLPQNLTTAENHLLYTSFPQYNLVNTAKVNNGHAFAAAQRRIEYQVLLDKINYLPDNDYTRFLEENDYDVLISDLGSNFIKAHHPSHAFIHSCSPVLDLQDANRFKNCTMTIMQSTANDKFATPEERLKLNDICEVINGHQDNNKLLCLSKAQDCEISSPWAIALQSIYDFSLKDISEVMSRRRINSLYGSFIYTDEILYKDHGTFEHLKMYWKIDRHKQEIMFSFLDGSMSYTHSLKNYLKLILFPYFVHNSTTIIIELQENVNGIQFFRINRQLRAPQEKLFLSVNHLIPFPSLANKFRISYTCSDKDEIANYIHSFINLFSNDDFKGNMTQCDIMGNTFKTNFYSLFEHSDVQILNYSLTRFSFVFYKDKGIVEAMISHALACSETKFKPSELFNYARSYTAKVFVNKSVLYKNTKIEVDKLYTLSIAVYIYTYDLKYKQGKNLQRELFEIDFNRKMQIS